MYSTASIKFLKLCLGLGVWPGRGAGKDVAGGQAGRQETFNPAPCTPTCTLGSGKGVPFQQMSNWSLESKALLCTAWALNRF